MSTERIKWFVRAHRKPIQWTDAGWLLSPEIRFRLWPCKPIDRAAEVEEGYDSVWGCSRKGGKQTIFCCEKGLVLQTSWKIKGY